MKTTPLLMLLALGALPLGCPAPQPSGDGGPVDDDAGVVMPAAGELGGACLANGTCNGVLACVANTCTDADPDAGPSTTPPTNVSIAALPATIDEGSSTRLTWSSTGADDCTIDQGVGDVAASGDTDVSPSVDTTYAVTCSNANGSASDSTTVTVRPAVQVLTFTANGATATTVPLGDAATLEWTTAEATSCSLSDGVGDVATTGSTSVTPTAITTYTLTCEGAAGPATADVTVDVTTDVTVRFFTVDSLSPSTTIDSGESAELAWSVANASACTLDDGTGATSVSAEGTQSVTPAADATYTLSCTGTGGPVTSMLTVNVNPPVSITSFTATPGTVDYGSGSLLEWTAENATSCALDQAIGDVQPSASFNIAPLVDTTYTLTCEGVAGPATASVTVVVIQPVSITSFSVDDDTPNYYQWLSASWVAENTDNCTLYVDALAIALNQGGTETITTVRSSTLPGEQFELRVVCEGVGGPVSETIALTVNNNTYTGNIVLCGPTPDSNGCTPVGTLADLNGINTLDGDLVMEGLDLPIPSLGSVVTITGSLTYNNSRANQSIGQIGMPSLRSVGDDLSIYWDCYGNGDYGIVNLVTFPELVSVGQTLTVGTCGRIFDAEFPALTTVGTVRNSTSSTNACTNLHFDSLQTILGDLLFTNGSGVADLNGAFPALTSVVGDVTLENTANTQAACDAFTAGLAVGGTTTKTCVNSLGC